MTTEMGMFAPSPQTNSRDSTSSHPRTASIGATYPGTSASTHSVTVLAPATEYYNPVGAEKNGSFCRNCGVSGPVTSSRCFPDSDKEHRFYFPGEKDDKEEEAPPKKVRLFWKILLVLVLLAAYGVSIAFIILPIQKYLDQPIATSVTILSVNKDKPVPFPGLQICSFDRSSVASLQAYYITNGTNSVPTNLNFSVVPIPRTDDYDYEFDCFEVNNNAASGQNLMIGSKRQKIILVVNVPKPLGKEALNSDCFPDLCDPDLDENATITDINPLKNAQGISLAAFVPDGVKNKRILDDVIYINTGSYSQVSVSYTKTFRIEPDSEEGNYTMRTSAVRYVPNSYAINFTAEGYSFQMDDVVFAEIGFGELAYTQINESKPYEPLNAFGDATAILGFFTGFGLFGGPTFLSLVMDNSQNHHWASVFYH